VLLAPWADESQLGGVISEACDENEAASVVALRAASVFLDSIGQPNGILVGTFMGVYNNDCIDDSAFAVWKDADADASLGETDAVRSSSLKALTPFFPWLEEQMESDDEDDEED
jgi:hypothetical protein